MGSLIGHVSAGMGFLLLGLWHLFNHINLYTSHPNSYKSSPWFKGPFTNYLELYMIIGSSTASIAVELFIGPQRHQPFDLDGTIPSNHLHNFEHSMISMSLLIYAVFAIILDGIRSKKSSFHDGIEYVILAFAFGQQFLIFHLHSSDHVGVEGQYHYLLQIVIFISLVTILMGIGYPRSFLVSFVRSTSIFFQGVWLIVMGILFYTPSFIAKGCFLNVGEDHLVVRCHSDEALHRAKSLVNLQFSSVFSLIIVFSMIMFVVLSKKHGEKEDYSPLSKTEEDDNEEGNEKDIQDVEMQMKIFNQLPSHLVHIGKVITPIDMRR